MFRVLLVLFFGIVILPERSESKECSVKYTVTVKYYKYGSWKWGWSKKTAYKIETLEKKVCCSGYAGDKCANPICGNSPNLKPCSVREGYYIVSKTETITESGGTCTTPGKCEHCNDGYYSMNDEETYKAFCKACKSIENCDKPNCTTGDETTCDKCSGETMKESLGKNAYTSRPDNTTCQETCSWVTGRRCYPGTCSDPNMLLSSCECSEGFNGDDCTTILKQPEIVEQMFVLNGSSDTPVLFLDKSNGLTEKVWTKQLHWGSIDVKISSTFVPNYTATDLARAYIENATIVGMQDLKSSIIWRRGNVASEWLDQSSCNFETFCNISFSDIKIESIRPWDLEFKSLVFKHDDSILFKVHATNGGRVTYKNFDTSASGSYYLNGASLTKTLELGFDAVQPYHTTNVHDDQLLTPDFSTNKTFSVSWDGWKDDLSGLQHYEIDAYLLGYANNTLKRLTSPSITQRVNVSSNKLTTHIVVEENGPYAVEIAAIDRAGNNKTLRRLLIVHDNSTVDIQGYPSEVVQANSNSWINEPSDILELSWPGRFINIHHVSHHWLAAVKYNGDLDDTHDVSKRNTTAIHNINVRHRKCDSRRNSGTCVFYVNWENIFAEHHGKKEELVNGTVRCEVSRNITLDGNTWDVDFIPVPQDYFDEEKMIIYDEEVIDGKKISFTIRAYDVMDAYTEDNVTVMIDTSPPVIDNLWLTDGDYLNLSIHNVLELHNLVFEWEVYDEHSGVDEVSWRIFDNYEEKLHGHSHEAPQGETKNIEECNANYSSYARGPNCYCSPYNGCYHKHYQIRPQITSTETGGVLANSTHGKHDGDYYIQVTAINNANLTAISYKKITIDTSPPHAGRVHDGLRDQPEVDFQQSFTLSAHWDDFFDKESSVWFYLYAFGTSCLQAEYFDIHNIDGIKVHKTYETSAEYIAPSASTYYVTVIAYNHALDGSKPVCSDGVTVDSTPVDVTEVVVKDAVIRRGLLKNANSGTIYLLTKKREIKEIINPTASQISKSTSLPETIIVSYPYSRYANGSKMTVNGEHYKDDDIAQFSGNPTTLIISDSHLTVSWNASETPSGVHDFEVGIAAHSSDYPDIRDFMSTHHHQLTTILYPSIWDGTLFDILIKTTTKSGITSVKTIGPIQVDRTPPVFQGPLTITKEMDGNNVLLIAKWTEDSFVDDIDPNPLSLSIAIGSHEHDQDINPFSKLTFGGSCIYNQHPTCSAIDVSTLPWSMHGKQTYYITVKAENTAGLYVLGSSDPYQHNVELASKGVVFDVDMDEQDTLKDIYDIDFQTGTTSLSTSWRGFVHPHEDISFVIRVYDDLNTEVLNSQHVNDVTSVTFNGLNLQPYTTYYQTVTAMTEAGNTTATSDGVTIIVENDELEWLTVFDGPEYNEQIYSDFDLDKSHHSEDKRLGWVNDMAYQFSTNKLEAHWEIPEDKAYFVKDVYWAIEERAPVADYWTTFRDYEHQKTADTLEVNDVALTPGRMYHILVKCCAGKYCYKPAYSSGVTITPNPPTTGNLTVEESEANKFKVELEAFLDTDIEDGNARQNVMDHYEWAITDAHDIGRLVTKWKRADFIDIYMYQFNIAFDKTIAFTKCWKLAVRGYTKAGLSSVVTSEMKNCSDINEVRPNVVIDAFGVPLFSSDGHEGQGVYLEENALWPLPDVDYIPYHNILSAVWPTLRHKHYTWAVLTLNTEDPLTFYHSGTDISLPDPCSHPDAIKCGTTENGYFNAQFKKGELQHGHRYAVCVHAPPSQIEHEFWTQELDEINACSDGVTVDLTPPTPADVWLGNNKGQLFQTSTSDLTTNWNSFTDVEEFGNAAHSSGIAYYEVAIGTSAGGTDIVEFVNVGLTNHKTFHHVSLKHGHTYFATIRAYDYTNQMSQSISDALKIDTTPPVNLGRTITIPSRYITNSQYVSACWKGVFEDRESGISHYKWCVGTSPGYDDIMDYINTTEDCSQTTSNAPILLIEGHSYFVSVKAFNNAGLWRTATSFAFTVDESPPVAGRVTDDGPDDDDIDDDIDYTTSTSEIAAHWTQFHDPHSAITECYVSVGTCAACEDVKGRIPVGLKQNVVLFNLHLVEGIKYYVTITAYNAVGLYTMASSDGVVVDTTPPIPGRVIDGILGNDIQYQASRKVVGCKWFGFYDPQSTISHYEWRLGTTRGGDDILPNSNVHKSLQGILPDYEMLTGQLLPLSNRIYCSVRAYNKAGMYIDASSNGLTIDTTAPLFLRELTKSSIGSFFTPGTSVLRSMLRVEWKVNDQESSIESQYLSISSHIGGDFNSSSTWVPGVARDHTFTDLDLHDGSVYDVKLMSCNGAKLCTLSEITGILIDSTPPTAGTFAIDTDHAAALHRQPDNWMTWTTVSLQLAWLGFQDLHSGIQVYYINVGSYFMGDDLNKVSGTPFSIEHDPNGSILEDGSVQTYELFPKPLSKLTSIYVSITAQNKVGLKSSVLHAEFRLEHGGWLSLVRRCDKYTCLGHCVCAPYGELCYKEDAVCLSELPDQYSGLAVKDFINLSFPSNEEAVLFSPLNTLLAAKWTVLQEDRFQPLWYEWSVGESSSDLPSGVFNSAYEKVWYEVGTAKEVIVTLAKGRELLTGVRYSFFIKAWYSANRYIVYKSPGVIITPSHPKTTDIRGRRLKEVAHGFNQDLDYISPSLQFEADWNGKFINSDESIAKYHLYLSTFPGGHNVHVLSTDLSPDVTFFNLTGLPLLEYTKYYTVVQAFSYAGLHTTVVSDGFMLDAYPPKAGVVHDGKVIKQRHATSSNTSTELFWHGFSDSESGVVSYEYCVATNDPTSSCDIAPYQQAGVATRAKIEFAEPVKQGTTLVGSVRAYDAAGHVSEEVMSNGVVIDTTSPIRASVKECKDILIVDAEFSMVAPTNVTSSEPLKCESDLGRVWMLEENSCACVVQTDIHGDNALILSGVVSHNISNVTMDSGNFVLTFYTSTVPHFELLQSVNDGFVDVNGDRHSFITYMKAGNMGYSWQKHTYRFDVDIDDIILRIGTSNRQHVIAVQDVTLEKCNVNDVEHTSSTGHVMAHTVFLHDWSSIHAHWTFIDDESAIVEYLWAIGTVEGGTQLQGFVSVGTRTFVSHSSLNLVHGSIVYITVVAVNAAGLRTVSYSNPIPIDLTPPLFRYVYDGEELGEDIDYQKGILVGSHWLVSDPESGLVECSWGLGIYPGDDSLMEYASVNLETAYADAELAENPNVTIYATVTCTNGANLTSSGHSDGVRILDAAPSLKSVALEVLGHSKTQYPIHGHYHGDPSEVRFRWSGFDAKDGIDSILVSIEGIGIDASELVTNSPVGYTYASFNGLSLEDGNFTISITAFNEVRLYSQKLSETFNVLTQPPGLSGNNMKMAWSKSSSTATCDWDGVFSSTHPLYFEVTVRLSSHGEGDLLQWQETTNSELDIVIDTTELPVIGVHVVFSVRAIGPSGLFVTASEDLFIS